MKHQHLKKALIIFLSLNLTCMPMLSMAGPLQPDGTTQTTLDKAGNNVPVVNIANPNASGLSHNKYSNFNVNAQGLILNNSTATTTKTQLGGYIFGNPHLTNSAKVILNEVTSTNRTSLNGYTEVAGPRTDLVIANPNGLTINGAGFINTANVTLTTGTPNIVGGSLTSYSVNGGDIAITGTGLDTTTQNSTRIYTQMLTLNAQLHATNLDIKLGNNTISHANGAILASAGGTTPTGLLLDASALGGMYANRIALVGTGAGLGVNLPPEVLASAGGIDISNDGTITVQKMTATQQVNVRAGQDLQLNGNLYAGTNMALTAANIISANSGVIAANGGLTLTAGQLTNNATLLAGLNSNGTLNGTGLMNISAAAITNGGNLQSTGTLGANVTGTMTNNGTVNAGTDLTLTTNNLTNNATLFAGNNMNLYTTGALANNAGASIFALNNLTMAANAAGAKTQQITNNQAAIEAYQGNLNVQAQSLQNLTNAPVVQGSYVAGPPQRIAGGVNVSTATTTTVCGFNCKNVTTTRVDSMVLTSKSAPATINAGGNMNLNANAITNKYSLISAGGNINLASQVVDNLPVDIVQVTTTSTAMYRNSQVCGGFNFFGLCVGGWRNVMVYVGTSTGTSKAVNNTVAATIQAGGSITGNAANLANGNIKQNQAIAASTSNPTSMAITPPSGSNGMFVLNKSPQSSYLIATNPKFTILANFLSSNYLLSRMNFTIDKRRLKLLGDAFYENKLIRDSIFAQTGKRFLTSEITSDNAQYQYLMDNALAVREDLSLVPGIALTTAQIAMLDRDIVWMVEKTVAGQRVLAPEVYIANPDQYRVKGGKILAGRNVDLVVDKLNNAGLIDAGAGVNVAAADSITNNGGIMRSGGNLSLLSKNDIRNISGAIEANNVELVSTDGSIVNERYLKEMALNGGSAKGGIAGLMAGSGGSTDSHTDLGKAATIRAKGSLSLDAAKNIAVRGSELKGDSIALQADAIEIGTSVAKSSFAASVGSTSVKKQSTTHYGSTVEGNNIAINSAGTTTVAGSKVRAANNLDVQAGKLEVLAVNNSSFEENQSGHKDLISKESTTTRKADSTNIAASLAGSNVSLKTSKGDIHVAGSDVAATDTLAMNSAGDIKVEAGFNGSMNETQTKKSGFFSGGKLFSKSEDLEGSLAKTARKAMLAGSNVSMNAAGDVALAGTDVTASKSLTAAAENITVTNVDNQTQHYSRHEKLDVGFGDALKSITNPVSAIKVKDGKASVTLAKAEYAKADKITTTTTVVGSDIKAGNISLTARADGEKGEHDGEGEGAGSDGNITIKGSNVSADGSMNLTADNNVTVLEAKNTERTSSKEQKGKAELKVSVKNEYVQIGYAIKAAKEAKDNLKKAKSDYGKYKQDLGKQRAKLIRLKADLANGKFGIEQADVDEMQALIDQLQQDDAFYKANIALAASDLAAKTAAVVTQMSTAAQSSSTYGFSASLDLDIDMLEKQFQSYKEQSVGSRLSAANLNIRSGESTTIRGSDVAANQVNIDSKNLNVLASQDVNTTSDSSDHKHVGLSVGIYGGGAGSNPNFNLNNLSGSAGMDSSASNSRGVTNTNSRISGNNIAINTADKTTIAGANVTAANQMDIKTGSLEVASVRDTYQSNSHSQGLSISGSKSGGVSGGGINGGMSHASQASTVLTTVTGGNVNIDVARDTKLKGAMIAAVDQNGQDNGNLKLKTGTLEVSSSINRNDSSSASMGLNVGLAKSQKGDTSVSSVGIDFANDNSHSKTKTLGTIGSGNVVVRDEVNSDTRMLNRDINDQTVDIYSVDSHKGMKGTIDARMLTKEGRQQIAEEVMQAGMITNTIKQIATDKTVGVTDFFSETDKQSKTYEAVKKKLAEDSVLAASLNNPDLTPQQKEQMLNGITDAVMEKLGYKTHENVIVADGNDPRAGHYQDGKAYINDANPYADSTGKLVTVAGHEASHAMDAQSGQDNTNGSREDYANNFGENLTSFTDMALAVNGQGSMADRNSHTGNDGDYVTANTDAYNQLDKQQGDNFIWMLVPVAIGLMTMASPANAPGENDKTLPRTDLSSPGDDVVAELAKKGEEVTGIPAGVLELASNINPKDIAKLGIKGIKSADDLIAAIKNGDVSADDLKRIDSPASNIKSGSSGEITGVDTPFRKPNPDFPPNQELVNAMNEIPVCKGTDCSEIADKLLDASHGNGRVLRVEPKKAGDLSLYENGQVTKDNYYHDVFSDGQYVYDPRLSAGAIPKGDWEKMMKKLNPDANIRIRGSNE